MRVSSSAHCPTHILQSHDANKGDLASITTPPTRLLSTLSTIAATMSTTNTNNVQANARQTAESAQIKAKNAANQIASHPIVQQGSQAVNQQLNALDREVSRRLRACRALRSAY